MVEASVYEQAQRIGESLQIDLTVDQVQRLGGLTNRNYRLDTPSGRFVLRLTGAGTGDYIDRAAELVNARIASEAGVNAEVVFFDQTVGVMLTRFLDGAQTMSAERFRDAGALQRAGQALSRLHACGPVFQGRFELFDQIERYLTVLRRRQASVPPGFEQVQARAQQVRSALARHPVPLVACHCDPMVENFLDDGERMYIIDFEYSGNNDPMWDLGDLSVEGGFEVEQDSHLLQGYFQASPTAFDHGRMVLYKAMCDLLWSLWGSVQHADGNPAEDFWQYSVKRLNRCRQLMESTDFGRHLEAVRAGGVTPPHES
jgi:thiamine kinase-like enzyme